MTPLAFGFDFDHTLGVDQGLERRALAALAGELGRPLDAGDPALRGRLDALLDAFRGGGISMDAMIERFACEFALRGARTERWRELCFALVDPLVRAVGGAPELVASLRARGIPSAILTNGWTPLQQKKIARALGPGAFATILVSDAVGAIKPERAAFDALAGAFDLPRERIWYVGDNARGDVGGALAAGLRAVWFDPDRSAYPADLPPPTLRIVALRELETLVENLIAP